MPRTHGYSKKGQRCYGTHDWGAKGRTNAIGALIGATLLTVSLFESTINSEVFTAWVQQDLIPKLPDKSVVVMDNASFHKQAEMQNALAAAGHTLFTYRRIHQTLTLLKRNGFRLNPLDVNCLVLWMTCLNLICCANIKCDLL